MRRTTKLVVAALLSVQFATSSSYAGRNECVAQFTGTLPLSKLAADFKSFMQATPYVDGGVAPDSPIYNQGRAEICWSYTLKELVRQTLFKITGGKVTAEISPDHNGFWHFYFQIKQHPAYFAKLRERVAAGMSIADATAEAVALIRDRNNSKAQREAGFVIESGSDEPTALNEAKLIGMVPQEIFNRPITGDQQAADLVAALNNLVSDVIHASPQQIGSVNKADGISDGLYSMLVSRVMPVLNENSSSKANALRPNDTFVHTDGNTYTPLSFMTHFAQFDPTAYVDIRMTANNQTMIYAAIQASLDAGLAIPVGWAVYQQKALEASGVADVDDLQQAPVALNGGHATIIENMKTIGGTIIGFIFKNSWGLIGLTSNGVQSTVVSLLGYFGITPGYLQYGLADGNPPDFLFHSSIVNANSPFAPLLKQVQTH